MATQLEEGQRDSALSLTGYSARTSCLPDTLPQLTDHTNTGLCETMKTCGVVYHYLSTLRHSERKETTTSACQVQMEAIERDFVLEAEKCVVLDC